MKNNTVTANNNNQVIKFNALEGAEETYSIDFSPWSDDNGAITSVEWSVKSGQSGISSETLSNNVAQATITFSNSGIELIKVTATTATSKYVVYLNIYVRDVEDKYFTDYGA